MKFTIGLLLAAVFGILAILHFYWAIFGIKSGNKGIPSKEDGKLLFLPTRLDSFGVFLGLSLFGFITLIESGFLTIVVPLWMTRYGMWIIAFIFFVRAIGEFKYLGFFKRIKGTDFARMDTLYYSPLCLLISALSGWLIWLRN